MRSAIKCIALFTIPLIVHPFSLYAQIVRGQVIDSITQTPVAGATVTLLDANDASTVSTVADEEGLFLMHAPEAGECRLRVEHDGYRVSTFPPFTLGHDEVKGFMLLVASLEPPPPELTGAEIIAQVCEEGSVGPGEGVVLGIVRGATGQPMADAAVVLSWPEVLAQVVVGDRISAIPTDSTGLYVACGVPGEKVVTFHAERGELVSDFIAVRFVAEGVFRGDTFHAAEDAILQQDFVLIPLGRHSARLTGVVTESDSQPVASAIVEIGALSVRDTTDAGGVFAFDGLPAGVFKVHVRSPGLRELRVDVELRAGDTITIPANELRLEVAPTELSPVVVEADAPTTRRLLAEFWERREHGGGDYLTREEFEKMGNPLTPTDILRRMRGLQIQPNYNYGKSLSNVHPEKTGQDMRRWTISTQRGGARSFRPIALECPPAIFIDYHYMGDPWYVAIDYILNVVDIEAVEVYSSATVPPQLNRPGASCGAIVFWTR